MKPSCLLLALLPLASCIDGEQLDTESSELAVRRTIDAADGAMILGTSSDRRFVAYGTECDAGDDRTAIKLYDTITTAITELDRGTPCQPGAVVFSPDGWLVAFGDGFGHLQVHDSLWKRTVTVSRGELSTIGIVFSPDSQWFVVAGAEEQPLGATLEAWDADLTTHVEIAQHAMFSPFAIGPQNIQISEDSQRLLFLGDLAGAGGPPTGTLKIWNRATTATRTIATGVAVGYSVRSDWRYVAYVTDVAATPAGPFPPSGDLIARDLVTNQKRTIANDVPAMPLGFAGDRLLYGIYGATPNDGLTLASHDLAHATTVTVDTHVFAGYGPNAVAITPDGSRIAYTRNFDPMQFAAELRVVRTANLAQPRTIAARVVPVGAYGWLDGGSTLGFLRDPTSTFPGATMGTLAAWRADSGATITLGTEVTQIGLAFDPASSELLFTSAYDMSLAAGDLRAWSTRTDATRLLDRKVAVMSVQKSPDGALAGYLTLRPDPSNEVPPSTRLRVSRILGPQRTVAVGSDVTSLSVGWLGRVVYTTGSGVFDAVAY